MKITRLIVIAAGLLISTVSCKKPSSPAPAATDTDAAILHDFAYNVAQPGYNDLAAKGNLLYEAVENFKGSQTDANLDSCEQAWYRVRTVYETTEGFLFGPVVTQGIDPNIDTWPVSYNEIDSLLKSNITFTDTFISGLSDALKGFHPIEYLLFGVSGYKAADSFNTRQIQLLEALSINLKNQTALVSADWNPQNAGNYSAIFTSAGSGNAVYTTKRAAMLDMVNAMAGICDEVGNEKIHDPFVAKNPALQESAYSNNSMVDFTNNMKGAQDVYLCKYSSSGTSLQSLVQKYNLSLDNTIQSKFSAVFVALGNITVPFGQAITRQPAQVQNAMNAINDLNTTLQTNLSAFINQYVQE